MILQILARCADVKPRRNRMSERNGAEIIVDHLISQRVPYLIGVCGHGDVGLMDAAYDRKDKLPMISVHNEQTAGFMADAYYRVTRQPLGDVHLGRPRLDQHPGGHRQRLHGFVRDVRDHRQRPHAAVQPWAVPGARASLSGRLRQRDAPVRQAQLPGHARRHAAEHDAPRLHDDARGTGRPRAPRRAAERVQRNDRRAGRVH